jgi:hypothetical protein
VGHWDNAGNLPLGVQGGTEQGPDVVLRKTVGTLTPVASGF